MINLSIIDNPKLFFIGLLLFSRKMLLWNYEISQNTIKSIASRRSDLLGHNNGLFLTCKTRRVGLSLMYHHIGKQRTTPVYQVVAR